jgi:hypothetical protein
LRERENGESWEGLIERFERLSEREGEKERDGNAQHEGLIERLRGFREREREGERREMGNSRSVAYLSMESRVCVSPACEPPHSSRFLLDPTVTLLTVTLECII